MVGLPVTVLEGDNQLDGAASRLRFVQETVVDYCPKILKPCQDRARGEASLISASPTADIYSQAIREEFRLGAASTVQKALQSLDAKDVLDVYKGNYFFIDPLFAHWIRRRGAD